MNPLQGATRVVLITLGKTLVRDLIQSDACNFVLTRVKAPQSQ